MKDITFIVIIIMLIVLIIGLLIGFVLTTHKHNEQFYKEETKKAKGHEEKGSLGESLVQEALEDICFYKGGYAYQGLRLEDKYGNWTEIDNIYISSYGVFIIETKYMMGSISGEATAKKWKQNFKGGRYIEFSNPLLQNKRHIAFFQRVFPDIYKITPLVIFVDPVKLHELPYMNGVMKLSELDQYFDGCKRIYRDSKVEEINKEIKQYIENPPFTHKEYANWVREKFYLN